MRRCRDFSLLTPLLILPLVVSALFLSSRSTRAHSFYELACCSDKDCAPVPGSSVTASPAGYSIILRPGDHPLVLPGSRPVQGFFPYADARVSPDNDFHACINPSTRGIICLYAPQGGV